ncbi:hypothetical protein MM239_14415 [Belliella sp. DSM 111904]|uniref:General stress protein CsbD n=1 Tax=Belliella filtrata TaxID=2923435 RepID=A0ABS9V2G3_9BACT|nr:hypothetical protein [Belliella filtrata]MCH7410598.1 hypothetical protein [Belliella filtrata]
MLKFNQSIKKDWLQIKKKLVTEYPQLAADELTYLDDMEDEFFDRIFEKTGMRKEELHSIIFKKCSL